MNRHKVQLISIGALTLMLILSAPVTGNATAATKQAQQDTQTVNHSAATTYYQAKQDLEHVRYYIVTPNQTIAPHKTAYTGSGELSHKIMLRKLVVAGQTVYVHVSESPQNPGTWLFRATDIATDDLKMHRPQKITTRRKLTFKANEAVNFFVDPVLAQTITATDFDASKVVPTVSYMINGQKYYAFKANNQQTVFISAAEATLVADAKAAPENEKMATQVNVTPLTLRTVVYSHTAAVIYQDPSATQPSGKRLSTRITDWAAFDRSIAANGQVVAYRLGHNQWVKASDLQQEKAKGGVLVVPAGTVYYDAQGQTMPQVTVAGTYQVSAERYINGHKALKLGINTQWVYAECGQYYE
ncbi:hypothetical protein ACNAN0_01250 [Agrilactobacillus fermenti]|uniref:hypothetical protein n=1 Tax=Agrilactobacillus fermenti TaxID=2586909 RepID=UPI003A5C7798